MYENYYGFDEKPFSLTPDPKFLYRSASHASAFELLRYAVERREGFAVVTGDIGTGKTTLCRALLDEIEAVTHSALLLNPFVSEEDLLARILVDFGVLPADEPRSSGNKQALVDQLYQFLLTLAPPKASAVLIIDEAQNVPLPVLEQVRLLSNLETDKDKLLQIILVGQLNLESMLASPSLRQLDQRVSIRHRLEPLDEEGVAAYVTHRMAIGGPKASVTFSADACREVSRLSGGIPRVINLLCDRALVAGFSARASRITADMVGQAARSLAYHDRATNRTRSTRVPFLAGAAVVLLASALSVGGSAMVYQRFVTSSPDREPRSDDPARHVPPWARATILVATLPDDVLGVAQAEKLTRRLEDTGLHVFHDTVDVGARGRWRRVLAGAYTEPQQAVRAAELLRVTNPDLTVVAVATDAPLEARP